MYLHDVNCLAIALASSVSAGYALFCDFCFVLILIVRIALTVQMYIYILLAISFHLKNVNFIIGAASSVRTRKNLRHTQAGELPIVRKEINYRNNYKFVFGGDARNNRRRRRRRRKNVLYILSIERSTFSFETVGMFIRLL